MKHSRLVNNRKPTEPSIVSKIEHIKKIKEEPKKRTENDRVRHITN